MIRNDQQLTVVREQLQRVEAALDSLRRDVLPQNADLFHLMAEPCLDTIDELRGQIDAYPGSAAVSEIAVPRFPNDCHVQLPRMTDLPSSRCTGPDEAEDRPAVSGWCQGADHGIGDLPVDQLRVRVDHWMGREVLRRIESGAMRVPSGFPHEFNWDSKKQGRFLESILLRLPLPPIFALENRKGQLNFVDGWHRLATLRRFLCDGIRLDLPQRPELHGKTFAELPVYLQNRLEDVSVEVVIIDSSTPAHVAFDLLERVNVGPCPSRQQLRHLLHDGAATRFLKDEAASDLFLWVTGGGLSAQCLLDCEFINRFCAFALLPLEAYDGNLDDFLAKSLDRMNALSSTELAALRQRLQQSLRNNRILFEQHAFRESDVRQSRVGPLNAALWDVMSTSFSRFSENEVRALAEPLREAQRELLSRPEFVAAISDNPNSRDNVQRRFTLAASCFEPVFDKIARATLSTDSQSRSIAQANHSLPTSSLP
jgi:hypothetical protein